MTPFTKGQTIQSIKHPSILYKIVEVHNPCPIHEVMCLDVRKLREKKIFHCIKSDNFINHANQDLETPKKGKKANV